LGHGHLQCFQAIHVAAPLLLGILKPTAMQWTSHSSSTWAGVSDIILQVFLVVVYDVITFLI
jgi:hypothetical protein